MNDRSRCNNKINDNTNKEKQSKKISRIIGINYTVDVVVKAAEVELALAVVVTRSHRRPTLELPNDCVPANIKQSA
jgi:hypothetical protein